MKKCLKSIEEKLKIMPVPINLPIGEGKGFCGITDLISLRNIEWTSSNEDGKKFEASLVKVS